MSKEKTIHIEDGNVEETVEKETEQKQTNETSELQELNESDETDKLEEGEKEASGEPVEEKDPLEAANEQIEKLKDQLLRTVAEFENYKKRTLKEKAELILNGGEKTIKKILPVIDDMERAIENGKKTDDVATLREGMDLIYKKFIKILEGEGVKRIETDGEDFNTDYHEAIAMVPGMGDDKKGKVIDCVQTGYTLNGKVIRYAKVAVGQ